MPDRVELFLYTMRELHEFTKSEPEDWRKPQGQLLASERRVRLSFAEQFAVDRVRDYCTDEGLSLGQLVDLYPHLSRREFSGLIAGEEPFWSEEEA